MILQIDAWNIRERDQWGDSAALRRRGHEPGRWHWVYTDRIARDAFVDTVFASAGLPILHVVAKAAYDPKEIHRQIDQALAGK